MNTSEDRSASDVPFVDLTEQYRSIKDEIDAAIFGVIERSDFILGEEVDLLEREFAAYSEVKHSVGLDNGTSALELALKAFGVGPRDEVITVANTFIATASAIAFTGARPVLVDADPSTYTIDPAAVEAAITSRTRALIPVHLYGQPADMDSIMDIARRHHLAVVEDACQAHGARYKGRRAGSIGDAAAFSFYPAKNLGAFGDGGLLATNREDVADRVRSLRNYGQRERYHHVQFGYNRRLDTLQAAVLRVKLRRLDAWNAARREHADAYRGLIGEHVVGPFEASYAQHVYHLFVIRAPEARDALRRHLQQAGIATGVHYPIPIHLQEAFKDLGYRKGDFPVTERLAEQGLSLPMFPELHRRQIERVSEAVNSFARGAEHVVEVMSDSGASAS